MKFYARMAAVLGLEASLRPGQSWGTWRVCFERRYTIFNVLWFYLLPRYVEAGGTTGLGRRGTYSCFRQGGSQRPLFVGSERSLIWSRPSWGPCLATWQILRWKQHEGVDSSQIVLVDSERVRGRGHNAFGR